MTNKNVRCQFPFNYRGVEYTDSCVSKKRKGQLRHWCYIKVGGKRKKAWCIIPDGPKGNRKFTISFSPYLLHVNYVLMIFSSIKFSL